MEQRLFETLFPISRFGSSCRYKPSVSCTQLLEDFTDEPEGDLTWYCEHGDDSDCSDFLDSDWLSSFENSSKEDEHDRYLLQTSLRLVQLKILYCAINSRRERITLCLIRIA